MVVRGPVEVSSLFTAVHTGLIIGRQNFELKVGEQPSFRCHMSDRWCPGTGGAVQSILLASQKEPVKLTWPFWL